MSFKYTKYWHSFLRMLSYIPGVKFNVGKYETTVDKRIG